MVSEKDIYRSALTLDEKHGISAIAYAEDMRNDFLLKNDLEAAIVWKKIIAALEFIQFFEGCNETLH